VEGDFDTCQALVKAMFNDPHFAGTYRLSAVNSINWARLMAQVVYYVYAAVRLGAPQRPVAFSVPTGNFGDVFAGYVAARMGLPIARLIVATNENDILARALAHGDYSTGRVTPTATPSMDIQVSSNFERLLFDLHGRDGAATAEAMASFERTRAMRLLDAHRTSAADLFTAHRADTDAMLTALRWAWQECGELIDPHTAVGLAAARAADLPAHVPIVTLATAHAAKFPDAVERAAGIRPLLPQRASGLFDRAERFEIVAADLASVEAHIAAKATPR
jgi:threonine synthase